mmetsp:Transcript_11149/g.31418  ORF Transcript_11149/g.31418 Transcript_11149/m.31418 type:complete len:378 (-) Transcript_11149:466-1599(-)
MGNTGIIVAVDIVVETERNDAVLLLLLLLLLMLLGLLPNQLVGIGQPLLGRLTVQQFLLGAAKQLPPLLGESRNAGGDGIAAGNVGFALLVQERLALLGPVGIEELDAHVLRQMFDGHRLAADGIDDVRGRRGLLVIRGGNHLGPVGGINANVLLLVVVLGGGGDQGLLRPGHAHLGILLRLPIGPLLLTTPISTAFLVRFRHHLGLVRCKHGLGPCRHHIHHLAHVEIDGLHHHKVVPIDPHGTSPHANTDATPAAVGLAPLLDVPSVFGPVRRDGQRLGSGGGGVFGIGGGGFGEGGGELGEELVAGIRTSFVGITLLAILTTTAANFTGSITTTSTTTGLSQQQPVQVHQGREVRKLGIARLQETKHPPTPRRR